MMWFQYVQRGKQNINDYSMLSIFGQHKAADVATLFVWCTCIAARGSTTIYTKACEVLSQTHWDHMCFERGLLSSLSP